MMAWKVRADGGAEAADQPGGSGSMIAATGNTGGAEVVVSESGEEALEGVLDRLGVDREGVAAELPAHVDAGALLPGRHLLEGARAEQDLGGVGVGGADAAQIATSKFPGQEWASAETNAVRVAEK